MLSAPVVPLLPGWHLKIFPQVHFHIKDYGKQWQKGPKAQSTSSPESWLWFLPQNFVFKVSWQSCNYLGLPKRLRSPAQDVIETWVQLNVVFVNVVIQIFCPQHLGYPHQLGTNKKQVTAVKVWQYQSLHEDTAAHSHGSWNLVPAVLNRSTACVSGFPSHTVPGIKNMPPFTARAQYPKPARRDPQTPKSLKPETLQHYLPWQQENIQNQQRGRLK